MALGLWFLITVWFWYFQDIKKDVEERNVTSAAQIPHFEGDFWNNKLENLIVDQKKDKTICEVEATAVHQKSMRVKNGNAGNQVE